MATPFRPGDVVKNRSGQKALVVGMAEVSGPRKGLIAVHWFGATTFVYANPADLLFEDEESPADIVKSIVITMELNPGLAESDGRMPLTWGVFRDLLARYTPAADNLQVAPLSGTIVADLAYGQLTVETLVG